MPTSASTAERIRDAIAEVYAEEPSPDQLAEQLAAVAAAHGLGLRDILLWIHDRPRHEMSAAHFLLWCERYGFLER
jgi:hypothetical protein